MKILCFLLLTLLISTVQSNIKILDTPDGEEHPEPCALTCSGISRHDDQLYRWFSIQPGHAAKGIDIRGCGFVTPPVISASIANYDCTDIMPYWTGKDTFYVMSVGIESDATMVKKGCDVSWIAVGYNC